MSREIKFKAWDRWQRIKGIFEPTSIDFENNLVRYGKQDIYRDDLELMQYTGLKDKNGKEVYEGDVAEIQQPTSTTRGRVEFREASFCFVSERYPNGESVIVHLHSIKYQNNWKLEVIGNIYENSDLLAPKTL